MFEAEGQSIRTHVAGWGARVDCRLSRPEGRSHPSQARTADNHDPSSQQAIDILQQSSRLAPRVRLTSKLYEGQLVPFEAANTWKIIKCL